MYADYKKPGRISDIAAICDLRKDAKLRCNSCIFFDDVARKCPHEKAIERYKRLKQCIKKRI